MSRTGLQKADEELISLMMNENQGRSSYVMVVTKCDKVSDKQVRQREQGRETDRPTDRQERRKEETKRESERGTSREGTRSTAVVILFRDRERRNERAGFLLPSFEREWTAFGFLPPLCMHASPSV